MAERNAKTMKMSDHVKVEKLQTQLSYSNRVIELFLPPEVSDVLDIMEEVVKNGLDTAFSGSNGMTLEAYAQMLSHLTYDALHTKRLHDEETF